ncbi:MAG: flagellar basal body P-ring formation chaperone FlgA [Bryobacteraceae bacterium]
MMWWIVLAMQLQPPACTPIASENIVAGDLARAIPEFSRAPADADIGYAPSPGSRRVFRIDELRRLATRFQVELGGKREACFEWPLAPLSREQAIAAMRLSLNLPEARVEVIELSKRVTPRGEVIFPVTSLIPPANRHTGTALWRGYVLYGGERRFDVWARVKISAQMSHVVVVTPIPAGRPIGAAEVKLETVDDFPLSNDAARNLDEVIGWVPRFGFAAGHAVLRSDVSEAIVIKTGDLVDVFVKSGNAHLKLQALAESSGHRGDMIALRNPKSGKTFRAKVEAEDKALVISQ